MIIRITGKAVLKVGDKAVESDALFDAGATKSFVNIRVTERLGYVRYEKPRETLLATKD